MSLKNKKILLIIGGGISAYKSLDLIRLLQRKGSSVKVILTKSGKKFVTSLSISSLSKNRVFEDQSVKTDIEKPLSKLRQSIASRLKQAQNTAAMLTTFNEIDMFELIAIRNKYKDRFLEKYGVKLGFMSFFTKAAITVLKEIPDINAEIKNNSIIYKNRYDVGIAVGTEKGLYVPVIRNADRMSFSNIESEIIKYGKMARENKLT